MINIALTYATFVQLRQGRIRNSDVLQRPLLAVLSLSPESRSDPKRTLASRRMITKVSVPKSCCSGVFLVRCEVPLPSPVFPTVLLELNWDSHRQRSSQSIP